MFYIDSHCHLDLLKNIYQNPSIEDDLSIKSISVTNAPFLFQPNQKLFAQSKNIRVALGMHPELIPEYHQQLNLFEESIILTKYIGEIGLDGSSNHNLSYLMQKKIFENILSIISSTDNKVLTVHSRNASTETISLLYKFLKNTNCKIILHWYSGNLPELKEAIKYNFLFSINHKMTSTKKGYEIIEHIPLKNILTETDAPFTFDKKINTRLKSLETTIEGLSVQKKTTKEEMKSIIFDNFKELLTS